MQEAHYIAIVQFLPDSLRRKRNLVSSAHVALVNAFDDRALAGGGGGEPAGVADGVGQRVMLFEFEDGRDVDAAGESGQASDGRDVNHVARKKLGVFGFVATDDEVIKIEAGDVPALALQLGVAHGAVVRWPAGGKQGVDQRAERTHGVNAGAADLSDDKDLNGAELAKGNAQFKVLEDAPDGAFESVIDLVITQAGDADGAYF